MKKARPAKVIKYQREKNLREHQFKQVAFIGKVFAVSYQNCNPFHLIQ